ncbi:MAG TPA: HAD family phosphatase [Candidatus Sumerlaeota bacterium]|nr:MAG: Phosphorylated carbohydrates phosphatase [candidate division BRC1 bacterium ADurb.BinA292]HOE96775.1 HAD family phosphatase [Candidatus Sumerlaeota bacterium]HOR28706.1 HAD family phosphatase [Candidatus Sumerlaeota bacterium]HPK01855.1 HAD family phosphatase [Candidatus Sumerlaeota bacterium]
MHDAAKILPSPPEAVLLDMDGVLFDSEPIHKIAWRRILAGYGFEFDDAFLQPWVGVPDHQLAAYLAGHGLVAEDPQRLLEIKRALYHKLTSERLRLFDGVPAGLDALRERGLGLALVTASVRSDVRHVLEVVGLGDYFPVVVTGNDVERTKPAADPYLRAAEGLGCRPQRCIVIEDSPNGIASARAAGAAVLAVMSSYPAEALAQADCVFPSTSLAIECVLARLDTDAREPARAPTDVSHGGGVSF